MTSPHLSAWPPGEATYRRSEVSAVVGSGDAHWERAAAEVLRWKVKTASGFSVDSSDRVAPGQRVNVTARMFGIKVHEPVEVVAVVEQPDRVGFAYKTLPGHPVSGEEAFIVHRDGEQVLLTVRSLTRAAPQQPWRSLFPVLLLAQLLVRKRYRRALL
ncbi:DUF1990 family protein [Arthrobacter sp. HLT1-20]